MFSRHVLSSPHGDTCMMMLKTDLRSLTHYRRPARKSTRRCAWLARLLEPCPLFLDARVFGFNGVREGQCLCQPIEQEGLHGGKSDNHEVGRPRPIDAPGIQQERFAMRDVRATWVCHKALWNRHRCNDGS